MHAMLIRLCWRTGPYNNAMPHPENGYNSQDLSIWGARGLRCATGSTKVSKGIGRIFRNEWTKWPHHTHLLFDLQWFTTKSTPFVSMCNAHYDIGEARQHGIKLQKEDCRPIYSARYREVPKAGVLKKPYRLKMLAMEAMRPAYSY